VITIKIAIIGYGTVGSGVYEVVAGNRNISARAGQEITVKYILDIRDFSSLPHGNLFINDFSVIISDPEISVVVETMGGVDPAYEYTKSALMAGKHVVTSNKELVATHGAELLGIAKQMNINYMFEASVGGGIPIIRPLSQCLAANEIHEILGILNGTTNYILTQMIQNGVSFERALADAQEKGYAERNPDADILGYDACRKIAILSSLACGKHIDYSLIHTEGITKITLADVEFASKMNAVIKLIALFKKEGDRVIARVSPMIVSREHPLATVEDVFNGIFVKGDAIGDVMFYGRGAGKFPTASAVVADVIDIARNIDRNKPLIWRVSDKNPVICYKDIEVVYYVRMANSPDAIANITAAFGEREFMVNSDEIAFTTPRGKDGELMSEIGRLGQIYSTIRVLEE